MAWLPTITPRTILILLDRSVHEMNPITTLRQNISRKTKRVIILRLTLIYIKMERGRDRIVANSGGKASGNGSNDNSNQYGNYSVNRITTLLLTQLWCIKLLQSSIPPQYRCKGSPTVIHLLALVTLLWAFSF